MTDVTMRQYLRVKFRHKQLVEKMQTGLSEGEIDEFEELSKFLHNIECCCKPRK